MDNDNIWGEIQIEDISQIPHVKNRIAIDQDVIDGRAVFYIPNPSDSIPIDIPIPSLGYQIDNETGNWLRVVIIQAENIDGEQLVGVRYIEGGNGVCSLSEIEIDS